MGASGAAANARAFGNCTTAWCGLAGGEGCDAPQTRKRLNGFPEKASRKPQVIPASTAVGGIETVPKLAITIACENYDRVQAIRSGQVEISGCDVNFLQIPPEELFFRAYRHQEFDVAELSMSSYLLALSRGTAPYHAIPVFMSRLFRHSAIYIRTDSGIKGREEIGRAHV